MTTSEKVAYLKGLAEGLGIGNETKEEKLLTAIIDVLDCIAGDLDDLEENALDLGEELDAISDDLSVIEDIVYDDDFDDDDCCCGGHHDHEEHEGCCGGHHDHGEDHECCCGGHHGEEPIFYEVTCPACNNTITVDEDVLDLGSIQCPNCGETLEFDTDSIEYAETPEVEGEAKGHGCCCGN